MTKETIYQQLITIITTYLPDDVSKEDVHLESDLTGELNINSAHLVDVVLDVEDAFEIEFANADMEKLRTVQDAITIIQAKLNN
jgi:acyl carrier protein